MKITEIKTLRMEEFSNICYVQIMTDEGICGLGETFFGAGKATASDKIFARLTSVVGVIFVIAALVLNLVH